ncbi:hypothetical protein TcWFU_009488 [Taenia crassiceps]|uniref:Uncharacterized protein n=1 Tax=Taenia crassiceps TaxID=6207 RepID=A0ABR4QIL0_9CEST
MRSTTSGHLRSPSFRFSADATVARCCQKILSLSLSPNNSCVGVAILNQANSTEFPSSDGFLIKLPPKPTHILESNQKYPTIRRDYNVPVMSTPDSGASAYSPPVNTGWA